MRSPVRRAPRPLSRAAALALAALALSSCVGLELQRDTETSGTFEATGTAFTIFAWDWPKRAIDVARENASDSNLPNMVVEESSVFPYLGKLDWIFDIISIRRAKIRGTWGYRPQS